MFRSSLRARIRKVGLVAHWPLSPSAEGAVTGVDLQSVIYGGGGPYDFTNVNAAGRGDGPNNDLRGAVQFINASSQYLSRAVTGKPELVLGGKGSFEITGWVFLDNTTGDQSIAAHYLTTGNQRSWWLLFLDGGSGIVFRTDAAGTGSVVDASSSPIGTATWAFFAARFDAARGRIGISINNGPFAESAQTAIFASTGAVTIGAREGPAALLDGRVTGLTFHKRLLTAKERTRLYNGGPL